MINFVCFETQERQSQVLFNSPEVNLLANRAWHYWSLHLLDPPSVLPGEALVRSEAGGERSAFITCSIDSNPPSKVRRDDDSDDKMTWWHDDMMMMMMISTGDLVSWRAAAGQGGHSGQELQSPDSDPGARHSEGYRWVEIMIMIMMW